MGQLLNRSGFIPRIDLLLLAECGLIPVTWATFHPWGVSFPPNTGRGFIVLVFSPVRYLTRYYWLGPKAALRASSFWHSVVLICFFVFPSSNCESQKGRSYHISYLPYIRAFTLERNTLLIRDTNGHLHYLASTVLSITGMNAFTCLWQSLFSCVWPQSRIISPAWTLSVS